MPDAVDRAYAMAMQVVRDRGVNEGVAALLAYCERGEGGTAPWETLRALDFARDAERFGAALGAHLRRWPVPKGCAEFYVGLDGLNMTHGKGVEIDCFGPEGAELGWKWGELPSGVLAEFYRHIQGGLSDQCLCVGYLGLILKDAWKRLPRGVARGESTRFEVRFGYHDGDTFRLGEVGRAGFRLKLEGRWLCIRPTAVPRRRAWPSFSATAAAWFSAGARALEGVRGVDRRIEAMAPFVADLESAGDADGARRLIDRLRALAGRGSKKGKVLAAVAEAEWRERSGEDAGAMRVLEAAYPLADGRAKEDVERVAMRLGQLERLRPLTEQEAALAAENRVREEIATARLAGSWEEASRAVDQLEKLLTGRNQADWEQELIDLELGHYRQAIAGKDAGVPDEPIEEEPAFSISQFSDASSEGAEVERLLHASLDALGDPEEQARECRRQARARMTRRV